jgi:hypothetical protein
MSKKVWIPLCVGVLILGIASCCGAGLYITRPTGDLARGPGAEQPSLETTRILATGRASAPSSKAVSSFGDGTWSIPDEVKPGTYTTTVPRKEFSFCFWQRLHDFSGNAEDIIAYGSGDEGDRMRVTISAKDGGFQTDGCGTWNLVPKK